MKLVPPLYIHFLWNGVIFHVMNTPLPKSGVVGLGGCVGVSGGVGENLMLLRTQPQAWPNFFTHNIKFFECEIEQNHSKRDLNILLWSIGIIEERVIVVKS